MLEPIFIKNDKHGMNLTKSQNFINKKSKHNLEIDYWQTALSVFVPQPQL